MRLRRLLAWYRREARDLPWRRTRDPYAIWVSEIMLQQTQVTAVIPYYERWMKRFPTVQALGRAPLDEVLKLWEGLGYYARARNLHKAARSMKRLPRMAAEWREMPGVGDSTAAAIASIAHGERAAVFDGNVRRVLSRLAGRDVTEAPLPRGNPGDTNQALMELGQRICLPRSPRCGECPLAGECQAFALGDQERWPLRRPSHMVPHHKLAVAVVWKGDRVFVRRRSEKGLLGGLWEFPGVRDGLRRAAGFDFEVGPHLVTVHHSYSHFSVAMSAYRCTWRGGRAPGRWVAPAALGRLAMSRADRRIADALRETSR